MKFKNKIRFIFCSFSLLVGLVLFSQKQSPTSCLELLNNNQAERALKCAQDMTKNTNSKNELAVLINIQGKALMAMQKPNAKTKFEESNRILNMNNIQDEGLQNENDNFIRMLTMMQVKNNNSDQEDLQSKMLNSTVNNPVKTGKNLGLEIVTNENKKLNEKLKNEKQVQEVLKNQKDSLFFANKDIQTQLTAKSSALDEMTQEQLKQQIILQEQAQLLTNITYQDSIKDIQVKLQEAQIKAVDTQKKYYAIISIALGLLLIGSIYSIYKATQNAKILKGKNDVIASEKKRADDLLHNILPESVVIELKENGFVNAKHFNDVSVCFIDFVSFSTMAESYNPQEILDDLNTCFKKFDEIITAYNLERIKTIGDCYMCAGGIQDDENENHIHDMVKANIEIMNWLDGWNSSRETNGKKPYRARAGIHSGPIAAGVVGTKKFQYDIWGDTVNIAARMEQNGEPGRINVSEYIYEKLNGKYQFNFRGEIKAKNKGNLKMYFLES